MKRYFLAAFACVVITSCTTGPTPQQLAAQATARAEAQRQADEAAAQERAREEAERAALAAKVAKAEATERHADEAAQSGDFQKALDLYATALSDNLPSDISSRLHDKVAKTTSDMEMAKIRAIENSGDDAAKSGDPQKAVNLYTSALHAAGSRSDAQQEVRERIAKYVSTLAQVPDLPEDAKRQAIDAQTRFKSGNTVNLPEIVAEMQQVMLAAPWWIDGYFNLGLMQERAGQFGEAARSLRLYVLAAPNASQAGAIQTKISMDDALQQALNEYQQQSTDESAGKVIKAAMLLDPSPLISEDARKHFVRGSVMFKDAKSPGEYDQAAAEFKQASQMAPWWPEARYNLALAYEGKGEFESALSNLKLYQLFKLSEVDARQTQDKIYAVQAEGDAAAQKKVREEQEAQAKRNRWQKLAGGWKNSDTGNQYTVTIDGDHFVAQNQFGFVFDGTIKEGNIIRGLATIPPRNEDEPNGPTANLPGENQDFSGDISTDSSRITINYQITTYNVRYMPKNLFNGFTGDVLSISPMGTAQDRVLLIR